MTSPPIIGLRRSSAGLLLASTLCLAGCTSKEPTPTESSSERPTVASVPEPERRSQSVYDPERGVIPSTGFVPDEAAAIAVAEAILMPIYGVREIEDERPIKAYLSPEGIWLVEGWLPPDVDGGVAQIWLRKSNAEVIRVTHEK